MTKYYRKVHYSEEFKERIEELIKQGKAKSIQGFVIESVELRLRELGA